MFDFQPEWKTWEERSELHGINAVLDPVGTRLKNDLIDKVQKDAISRIMANISNRDVCLDFGCGIGRLHDFLRVYFSKYIGIDVTAEMISKAKQSYDDDFYLYDGINMPLGKESIDTILSVLVLQHINKDDELYKIISEFRRIVKTNGTVVFIEQINDTRSTAHYIQPFEKNGFTLQKCKVIRCGWTVSSFIASRKICGRLPERMMLKILSELNSLENVMPKFKKSYKECIFVFRKES